MEKEIVDSGEWYALAPLRELDLENESDLTAYFQMLTHRANIEHFASQPKNPAELKTELIQSNIRTYIGKNLLGENVGGGGIENAPRGQHDHLLVKVVVHPDYQGNGIGRQLIIALTDMAFSTPAVTTTATGEQIERERIKLDAAVIREVESWDRMPRLLRGLGFKFIHLLDNEVDIIEQSTGNTVIKPTERYEISREDWFLRKDLRKKTS
jgi:GNAT superfamily N-acetyltransferase